MEAKRISNGLYKVADLFLKLIYINLMWIVFTLVGCIILGFFPATAAMFTVLKRMREEDMLSIFKTFWHAFKTEFLKANGLGSILILAGLLLLINFKIVFFSELSGQFIISGGMFVFLLIFLVVCLYFFPVYVHLKVPFFQFFKTVLFVSFISPLTTLMMISVTAGILYLLLMYPGYIPILGASIIGTALIWVSNRAFLKIERLTETN